MAAPDAVTTLEIHLLDAVVLFGFIYLFFCAVRCVCVCSVWTAIELSTSGENHLCCLIPLTFCFQGDNQKVYDWNKEAARCVRILILPHRWK